MPLLRTVSAVGLASLMVAESSAPSSISSFPDSQTDFAALVAPQIIEEIDGLYSYSNDLTTAQNQALRTILNATIDQSLRIKITGRHGEVDANIAERAGSLGEFDYQPPIIITLEDLVTTGFRVFHAHGQFRSIELTFDKQRIVLPEDRIFRDRFGNLTLFTVRDEEVRVRIMPQSPFGDGALFPYSFELSLFGLEDLIGCFSSESFTHITHDGPYRIFSNLQGELITRNFRPEVDVIANAVADCEGFFGVSPCRFVHEIAIVNMQHANAFFCCRDPNAIQIGDELLMEGSPLAPVARHETLHLIDEEYQGSDLLLPLLRQLRQNRSGRNFLKLINESKFLPNRATGGHTHSNVEEFFASFINSLVSTTQVEWEESIEQAMQREPTFPVIYGEALQALEPFFFRAASSDAPCHERIQQMRHFLEEIYERNGLHNPWGPVLGNGSNLRGVATPVSV